MARIGSAQNGWIMFAVCSPIATAIAVTAGETPSFAAAGSMIGACTAQWPPPYGTNSEIRLDDRNVNSGNVRVDDTCTAQLDMRSASELSDSSPRIPP